jgi:hypothetical protein
MAHDGTAHAPTLGTGLGQSSSLSPWAGPYVTDMLGKGAALSAMPYQAYQGPLTAGQSGLQGQAFQGLANLAVPTATTAGSFTAPGMAQQYMNPYLEGALAPQMAAAQRDAAIQQQKLQGQYTRAGAYGGGRQAIAEAELQRGLLDRMSDITGQGYQQAYDKASDLFNQERTYGLEALQQQATTGATQRGIESEGIAADIAQFETERDYPYKQTQYMQSLLQGLPISTQEYQYQEPTGLGNFGSGAGGTVEFLKALGFKFD